MPEQTQDERRAPRRKPRPRKRGKQSASTAIVPAAAEPVQMAQPRPRIRLRSAMRAVGLDEWKIAWNLNAKVDQLSASKYASDTKLLLDYLKEATRHLDPASASANAASQEAAIVEVVHQVPRPDRSIAES